MYWLLFKAEKIGYYYDKEFIFEHLTSDIGRNLKSVHNIFYRPFNFFLHQFWTVNSVEIQFWIKYVNTI